jgi:ADP-ribose pyrophosphatase YjhB (NUDIX family)
MSTNTPANLRKYPQFPRLGVGVLVFKNDQFLLIKRNQEPGKGLWTVPGGLVELGESLEQAAHREVYEECRIRIKLGKNLDIFEYFRREVDNRIKYHYIVIDYIATYVSGNLLPGGDISAARWMKKADLCDIPTTQDTIDLIDKAFSAFN